MEAGGRSGLPGEEPCDRPEDVVLRLDPEAMHSCKPTGRCAESGAQAIYAGTVDASQLGMLFGAGCVPGHVNPTGEPDLTPITGDLGYAEVGLFEKVE